MKHLYLLCCALSLATLSYSQNAWQWLNPQPEGYNNLKIVFTDHQKGFILNLNGDLMTTADQGGSWNVAGHFPFATSFDVHDNTGVIASSTGALYVSSDNGSSWDAVRADSADQFAFVNVVSQDSFFVSTTGGTIYATGDKGRTWAVYHCGAVLECLSWVNSMLGYVGTNTGVMKTVDGGKTWKVLNQEFNSSAAITTISFPSADTGYAYRFDSVLVTHDGGSTWQEYGPYAGYPPNTMDFVNDTLGFMAGESGAIYRSTDGGKTFAYTGVLNSVSGNHDLNSLAFVSVDTGFAVGLQGQIWKTVDTGNTWTSYSPSYVNMYEACFPSATVGYAVNRNNIFKTTDGGKSWNQLALTVGTNYGSNTTFSYVHFSTADSGFAVSTETVAVYKTGDGGQTWTTIYPTGYSYETATGIWYGGHDSAVLCMGTAMVLTADGGNTWSTIWTVASSQASGPPYILGNIFYVNSSVWYAAYQGLLYKTTNGGQSWTQMFSNSLNYSTVGISFFNAQQGFIGDEEGYIFKTMDGGATWQTVKEGNVNDEGGFNGIVKFFSPQVGYMTNGSNFVGSWGRVYKTVDGGQSWQLSHNYGGVSIDFTADSNVVIAGYGGAILRESVGGWQVDSLSVSFNNSCGTVLTGSVGAAFGTIDSVQFQVTSSGGKTMVIAASPDQVANGRISVSTILNGLTADTLYSARMKFDFNGTVAYSDTVAFMGEGLTMPFIFDSLGTLVSSASTGNQWYLNGSSIAGATGRTYKPDRTGSYTVQTTQNSCVSPMSQSVIYRANDLGVVIYPNPAHDYLYILNTQYRSLAIRILDMAGRTLMTESTYGYGIQVSALVPGQYMLEVVDKNSGEKAGILFLKF